jgi:hypothetical protein
MEFIAKVFSSNMDSTDVCHTTRIYAFVKPLATVREKH